MITQLLSHGLIPADFPAEADVELGVVYGEGAYTGTLSATGGDAVNVEIIVTEGVIQ